LYDRLDRWAVFTANARFLHVRETLVMPNGSGDTSYAWAQFWLYLILAGVACVVWSALDRKRPNYQRPLFWLRMALRYYLAAAALGYGILKLFALQMVFPGTSTLATPLGDLLPMRLSWLFIGYSTPYQIFAGFAEALAGVLLLFRRTITAGLLVAVGAFANVVMINIAYDVPAKLYSMHLLFCSLFLVALDSKRLFSFFVLNRVTPGTSAYDWHFTARWQRYGMWAVKAWLLWLILVTPFRQDWSRYSLAKRAPVAGPIATGMYEVTSFTRTRGTMVVALPDSLRWKDVIFDNAAAGSVNTKDGLFWQRYGRGYFRYRPDSVAHSVSVWKTSFIPRDSTFLFTMRYAVPDSTRLRLWGVVGGDSLVVELARTNRHFQLAERQFHWISEYNR
jgi:hypothetical protein